MGKLEMIIKASVCALTGIGMFTWFAVLLPWGNSIINLFLACFTSALMWSIIE